MKDSASIDNKHTKIVHVIFILMLLIIFTIYYRRTHGEAVAFDFQPDYMTLTGADGSPAPVRINFSNIVTVTEASGLDIGTFVDGCNDKLCMFGTWQNEAFGTYTLCAYPKVNEFIVIKTTDSFVICNYESDDATLSLYKAMLEFIRQAGYEIGQEG